MATTYEAIATVEVGSGGAANMEFTSIPATYTDLLVLVSARGTSTGNMTMKFNNSSDSTYDRKKLFGDGGSPNNGTSTGQTLFNFIDIGLSTDTSNTFGNASIYIPNYAGSTNKSFSIDAVSENNAATAYTDLHAGLRTNTAAITVITLALNSGDFVQYSTATLYGIKNS
jgi:hypothetical protein